jgi:hypothetical protein
MTTTDTGWLGLQRDGTVADIGPNGIRETVTLEGEEFRSITGVSLDRFFAINDRRTLFVRNGDTQTEYSDLVDSGIWPNGEIWTVMNGDQFEVRMNGAWTLYPGGGPGVRVFGEMGPSPGSPCRGSDVFARGRPAFLYRWNSGAQTWDPVDGPDTRTHTLGCFPGGRFLATDWKQGFWVREPNGWSKHSVLERQVQDTVVHDDTLYVGGFHGNHALVTESETRTLGSGFWAPDISTPDRFERSFRDLWVSSDGEQVVLSYEGKPYRSTGDGWSLMPGREDDRLLQPAINDICGIDEPMFGLNDEGLFRWNGQKWVEENVNGDPRDRVQGSELECTSEDSVWMTAGSVVYHHDGEGWSRLGSEDSSLMSKSGLDNPTIRSMTVESNERLVVGAEHSLFELREESGEWSVQKMLETPCRYVTEHLLADDGTLWVGGWDSSDGCIASVQDGPWTQYRVPKAHLRDRRGSYRIRPRGFVSQPGTDTPLILTKSGVLQPQEDGTVKNEFMGNVLDGAYVSTPHATLVLHERGVVAKYYD